MPRLTQTSDVSTTSFPANAFSLEGNVALITGGGTGLGLGIARCLVWAGARVVLVGRRSHVLQTAVRELGPSASYQVHDITALETADRLVTAVEQAVGPVSILVNNAGVHLKKPAVRTTDEEFQSVFQTHVFGAFALTRTVASGMFQRTGGSILFIASMTSFIGMPDVVAYSSAKSAYLGMVRSLCSELAPKGIRVNAIAPGWIDTPILQQALQDDSTRKTKILDRTPMGAFGRPWDIGLAAVYLCSPAARFVSGVVLPVDGGASIGF